MRTITSMLAAVFTAFLTVASAAHESHSDANGIMHVMMAMFDKPDMPLSVDPIAIEDGFAVAGWTQGEMGGRAFLRKEGDHWMLILCTGDEIRSAAALAASGVPPESAKRLAAKIVAVEKDVSPERLALFANFSGVVRMDEGEHPPH